MERIVGGIIREKNFVTTGVDVSWAWESQTNGTVKWTFKNLGSTDISFLLFRNGYYFGNAFWPVYLNNPQFNESFASSLTPLINNGSSNNSAPLGIANFPNGKKIVCFVFTLAPKQVWSMLEGGFSTSMEPSGFSALTVDVTGTSRFCITYDETQVVDWDNQTGTGYKGYSPNPSSFTSVLVNCKGTYVQLFKDIIVDGQC